MNFNFNFSNFGKTDNKASTSTTPSTTTTPSTSTTTSTTTTSTTAQSTTPFNFNFGTNKTSSTSTTSKTPENVVIPPELKNKKVKEIIESMESQLEQQARQFQTQASQIARWDRSIYDLLDQLEFLEEQVNAIDTTQKELSASAISLLTEQENFIKTLKEKTSSEDSVISNDQRAKLYRKARKLGEDYNRMESELKKIVENTENNDFQTSLSDIDKVVQISNCHLDSLQWITNCCTTVEEKLNAIYDQIRRKSIQYV